MHIAVSNLFVLSLWRTLTNTRFLPRPLTLRVIHTVAGDEGQGVRDLLLSAKYCGKESLAGAIFLYWFSGITHRVISQAPIAPCITLPIRVAI